MRKQEGSQQIAEFFRGQFFSLFKTRQKHERKLNRVDYINEQVWTSLCQVLKVEKDYELSAPDIAACIEHIIKNVLPTIFVQKFQKPTTSQLDWGVKLAEDKATKEKRVALLELEYLEALAKMTSTLNTWLFYFQVKEMICELENPNHNVKRVAIKPSNQLTLLPAGDTMKLYSKLKDSLDRTVPECCFEDTMRFFNLMRNYEMEGQIRCKNASELRCKLERLEIDFQIERRKSLSLLKCYTEELKELQMKLTAMKLEQENNNQFQANLKKETPQETEALITVISLFESTLRTKCQTLQSTQMVNLLERKLQSLQDEIFYLKRGISSTEQVILEKEWIAKERIRLKNLVRMQSVQKRAERLEKKSKSALLRCPEKIAAKPENYFVKMQKKKKKAPPVELDHNKIEDLVCFDENCSENLFVQIYKPQEKTSESGSRDGPMCIEWVDSGNGSLVS